MLATLTPAPAPAPVVDAASRVGSDDGTLSIVDLCRSLDVLASEIYAKIAASCESSALRAFWSEMADEERLHVRLWERVQDISRTQQLPPIFDDANGVKASLTSVMERVVAVRARWESEGVVSDPFVVACRLEVSMLQPAFAALFHFCRTFLNIDFYRGYEDHLNRFLEMLASHGTNKPELELLGDLLRNLWRENKALTRQANHDHLTGLLNRRGFWLLARQWAYYAQRNGSHVGVLMMDVDDFRAVNEHYGHPAGDLVLRSVADTLRARLRKSDIVGRYGGEEFVVICPEVGKDALSELAESIRRSVEDVPVQGIRVTVSIGAIEGAIRTTAPEKEMHELIARADDCLYLAKHAGKNKVTMHDARA